jgi:hypothetical protein
MRRNSSSRDRDIKKLVALTLELKERVRRLECELPAARLNEELISKTFNVNKRREI